MKLPASISADKILLDADALRRTLSRVAHEVIESNPDLSRVALVGIQTRGVPLAQRLRRLVEERAGDAPALGAVDITFYRDDVAVRGGGAPLHPQPVVRSTALDFPLEGKTVVLVDDVLYTGRTIRAAIEALFDYGRPDRIQLAVLVDADVVVIRARGKAVVGRHDVDQIVGVLRRQRRIAEGHGDHARRIRPRRH